jgi:hypothetical protein
LLRNLKLFIGIIFLTILLTFTIVKVYFPTTVNNNYYLLKMKGQSEHWKITDYQFASVPNKGGASGSETVTYLGNPNELEGEIVVEIYDFRYGTTTPSGKSITMAESLMDGSFKAGGGGGSLFLNENLSVKDIVKSTYFHIRWNTEDGEQHEETLQAELDYDPMIIAHIN